MSSSTEGQDFSRHRIEAVYQDGSRVLFTHVDLMREQVTAGAFSRELATLIGEDILIRLGAASRQPR